LVSSSEGSPSTADLPNGDVVIKHGGTGVVLSPSGEHKPVPTEPGGTGLRGPIYAIDDSIIGRVWDEAAQASPVVQIHFG